MTVLKSSLQTNRFATNTLFLIDGHMPRRWDLRVNNAGHETSASSIHLTLALLALHPQVQRSVQKELMSIFGGRPVSEWDYEHDLPRLLKEHLAAVLNEQLRLIAPVVTIPKISSPEPQTLLISDKTVRVPGNTMTRLCLHAVHCNPRYWSHKPYKPNSWPGYEFSNPHNDFEGFRPERWFEIISQILHITSSSCMHVKPPFAVPQTRPSDEAVESCWALYSMPNKDSLGILKEDFWRHRYCMVRSFLGRSMDWVSSPSSPLSLSLAPEQLLWNRYALVDHLVKFYFRDGNEIETEIWKRCESPQCDRKASVIISLQITCTFLFPGARPGFKVALDNRVRFCSNNK